MSFLRINNFDMPIRIDAANKDYVVRELKDFSLLGNPISVVKSKVKDFSVETVHLTDSTASIIEGIVEGYGHFYPFINDTYSSKGKSPAEVSDYNILSSGKYGSSLEIIDFAEFYIYNTKWTILFWKEDGGSWMHYAETSEGTIWENTVEIESQPAFWDIINDVVQFTNVTIADLIIVPYNANIKFVKSHYTFNEEYSYLPRLKVSGAILNEQMIYEGEIENMRNTPFSRNGFWNSKGRIVELGLTQVQ